MHQRNGINRSFRQRPVRQHMKSFRQRLMLVRQRLSLYVSSPTSKILCEINVKFVYKWPKEVPWMPEVFSLASSEERRSEWCWLGSRSFPPMSCSHGVVSPGQRVDSPGVWSRFARGLKKDIPRSSKHTDTGKWLAGVFCNRSILDITKTSSHNCLLIDQRPTVLENFLNHPRLVVVETLLAV